MKDAKKLLQILTDQIPPGEGQKHNMILDGDRLIINLMLGKQYQPVLLSEKAMDQPAIVIASEIHKLMAEG